MNYSCETDLVGSVEGHILKDVKDYTLILRKPVRINRGWTLPLLYVGTGRQEDLVGWVRSTSNTESARLRWLPFDQIRCVNSTNNIVSFWQYLSTILLKEMDHNGVLLSFSTHSRRYRPLFFPTPTPCPFMIWSSSSFQRFQVEFC